MSHAQRFWSASAALLLISTMIFGASSAIAAGSPLGSSGIDKRAPMCYRTGIRSYHDGDLTSARQWLSQAAALGHADAMYRLAHMYMSGEAGEQNLSQAANLLKSAAEAGHVAAGRDFQALQMKRADPDSEIPLPQASIPAVSPPQRPERTVAQPLPGMPPVVRNPAERPKPLVIEPIPARVPASERPQQIELPRQSLVTPTAPQRSSSAPSSSESDWSSDQLPEGMAIEPESP